MTTLEANERQILEQSETDAVTTRLQQCLTTLIDLSLQLKQAHWNLLGDRFLSFHVQLDEIIATSRKGSDEVAERIAALGVAADGRPDVVSQQSKLEGFPEGRHHVDKVVTIVADRLKTTSHCLRESIAIVGDPDPISEDLLIGICAEIEKHLWMVQSQEL